MAEFYALTLNIRVYDRKELFEAALKHAVSVDQMAEADARKLLSDEGEDDGVDVFACLRMVIDPGVSPDGCEIQDSEVVYEMSDDAEDESEEDHTADDLTPAHELPCEGGPVSITLAKPGADRDSVVEQFATIRAAESFLNLSAGIDPDDLAAGHYGINAPHGAGSDNEAIAMARRLGLIGPQDTDAAAAHRALATVEP
jgi:hypothetical protein